MSLSEIARTGDRMKTLEALRNYLAEALDQCDSDRDKASLSLRLIDCINEIDGFNEDEEETAAERIKRRAEERRAAAQEATGGAVSE